MVQFKKIMKGKSFEFIEVGVEKPVEVKKVVEAKPEPVKKKVVKKVK